MKQLLVLLFIITSFTMYSQTTPKMVYVKGGTFKMGNSYTDKLQKGNSDERPVHSVTVSDFYIGKYEVTVLEFKKFILDRSYNEFARFGVYHRLPSPPDTTWWRGHQGSEIYWKRQSAKWWGWNNSFPMFHVSWYSAIAYCNWLSIQNGYDKCYSINSNGGIECDFSKNGYRLPTEAEWEYAAKGGNKSKKYRFSGSNNVNQVGWIDDNTLLAGPKPVGTKIGNELGIHDMTGNVWEWCTDYYSPYYYNKSPSKNPVNLSPTGYRVIRGGSWHYNIFYASTTARDGPKSGYTNYNYGFRIVRAK